jgi:hypothetical protein
MRRLLAIAGLGFALAVASQANVEAATRSLPPGRASYYPYASYGNRPCRLVPGYEYQLRRGTARTAAGYTSLFGI